MFIFLIQTVKSMVVGLGLACFLSVAQGESIDAGLFYDNFPLTLAAGERTEIAGPGFFHERNDSQLQWAMPPFWSDTRDTVIDSEEFDLLYPLLTYDRYGAEYRFQILQLFNFTGGQNQKEETQRRFTLFPFYFQQRSPDTNLNYTALFPIYGHLIRRPLNLRDDIRFVLFPLYARTVKRDVVTENYLFPFYHQRRGTGLKGWQLWPLLGHEQKTLTYKTNLFDTVEAVGGHDKWFALWPFYFNSHTGLGTTNPAAALAIIPAYARLRSPQRDSTTVLWPFFSKIDDREKKYQEWHAPYPVVVFARGEGKTTSRVWPFFGRSHSAIQSSDFYAWPLYQQKRLQAAPLDRTRTRIFFFLYSDIIQRNTETEKSLRRVDLFPFFTFRRDYNGDQRLQVLAPVEPFLPNNKSIERNYSPLWSLWRAEASGPTGATSESLLWNLYRHERHAGLEKTSLLFGLFRYQSDGAETWLRLFHLPVWNQKSDQPAAQFQPLPAPAPRRPDAIAHPQYDAVSPTP
jgi:hypothetical protein